MISNLMGLLLSIKTTDIIDIVIVAFLLYKMFGFIRETRAQQMLWGILLIVAVFILSEVFDLSLLNWLLTRLITVGLIAVVILFQPEIRRALEQLGRRGVFRNQFKDVNKESAYATVHMLIDAVDDFSSTKTGALIVMTHKSSLEGIIETGDRIDAVVNRRLIENLFFKNSPLHDGAVVMDTRRLVAARCTLPISESTEIPAHYGMRHRAAVGVTEMTDATVIVVSEETGGISFVKDGEIKTINSITELRLAIEDSYSAS